MIPVFRTGENTMSDIRMLDAPPGVTARNKGVVLVMAMIFIVVFSSLGVAMATFSNSNLQVADNLSKGNRARMALP